VSIRLNLVAIAGLALALFGPCRAQQLPTLAVPAKGETQNMTLQTGTRSQLSFGSSTSIGTSASLTATEGAQASTKSSVAPAAGGSILFRIGYGDDDKPSSTTANIQNLKASGSGTADFSGSTVTGNNASGSSGQAQLTGVQSQLSLTLDSSRTEFSSAATSFANVSDPLNPASSNTGSNTGTNTGSGQTTTTPGSGSTTTPATTTTSSTKIANTSGAASINSNTNVDINNTSFTSVFMQAF